jgi:hypothetical protein
MALAGMLGTLLLVMLVGRGGAGARSRPERRVEAGYTPVSATSRSLATAACSMR